MLSLKIAPVRAVFEVKLLCAAIIARLVLVDPGDPKATLTGHGFFQDDKKAYFVPSRQPYFHCSTTLFSFLSSTAIHRLLSRTFFFNLRQYLLAQTPTLRRRAVLPKKKLRGRF